ncbi:GNAT family N-acetyltransferase [Natrinema versiforme]|uniref:GNAT family N-acetyltransferase n=1 Tax=Natrinema versiforme TaxID=88724 RepID=A0A4P8WG56_9EURY|nr:GNAT family N-acetyltransferase [Natrinema versiforme]QCS41942.1 GNAT family N-acetyltransferase [Natrinema versiforme]
MSLDVRKHSSIKPVNRNQWNQVVTQSDQGSVFHRYEWLRAIEDGTSLEPRHLHVSKKGNPIAILPNFVHRVGSTPIRRLVSVSPGSGGPVAMTDEEAAVERLVEGVSHLCSGLVAFNQLRMTYPESVRYHDFLKERGYRLTVRRCRFTLDLTRQWDRLSSEMHSSRRRAIEQGHDQEYEIVDEVLSETTLSEFYDNFSSVMDRVEGDGLPRSFFRALGEFPERVTVFSLRVDGDRRGMIMVLLDDDRSTLHYQFSGITEDHFEYNASELLHEHAIKWGIEHGYETYDFRGTDPDFRDGLFRFKERFGGKAKPMLWWERGHPTPALPALNAGRTIYRRYTS